MAYKIHAYNDNSIIIIILKAALHVNNYVYLSNNFIRRNVYSLNIKL